MADTFEVWEAGRSISENKYLESISYKAGKLVIRLKGTEENAHILTITFNDHFSFKNTNESFRLNSIHRDKFQNGINYSRDSGYLRWIKEETTGVYDDMDFVHYLIGSNDDITDVISASAPVLGYEPSI